MEEKNRLAATRWRALPEEEKKKFEEVAKKYKHPDVADWSQEERNKFIARHRRQLLAEVSNNTLLKLNGIIFISLQTK